MLRALRRALITLGVVGVLCRALVPVGLMPAPLAAGGPFAFCPGGAAGALFRTLATHERAAQDSQADHDVRIAHAAHEYSGAHGLHGASPGHASIHERGDAQAEHAAWEHCAFGAAFAQVALAPVFGISLLALEHTRAAREQLRLAATIVARPYWARGPPALTA